MSYEHHFTHASMFYIHRQTQDRTQHNVRIFGFHFFPKIFVSKCQSQLIGKLICVYAKKTWKNFNTIIYFHTFKKCLKWFGNIQCVISSCLIVLFARTVYILLFWESRSQIPSQYCVNCLTFVHPLIIRVLKSIFSKWKSLIVEIHSVCFQLSLTMDLQHMFKWRAVREY